MLQNEWWALRESPESCQCEEELYVKGRTAVWSKREGGRVGSDGGDAGGGGGGAAQDHTIICCYTSDSPISHALWTTFHTAATDKPALGNQGSSDIPLGEYELPAHNNSVRNALQLIFFSSLQENPCHAYAS